MASIVTPFYINSSGRVAKTTTAEKAVEQQIVDVLVTSRLERTMRPGYGAGAMQLLYEPVDDLIYGEFKTDALMELNKQITTANVVNVFVGPARSPYIDQETDVTLEVTVQYRMPMSGNRVFTFQIADLNTLTEETTL
jgi:phage baseplate assembly protein W